MIRVTAPSRLHFGLIHLGNEPFWPDRDGDEVVPARRFGGAGMMIEAPGVLARRYAALGGRVFYHGKPYPAIYRSCLDALDCAPQRVLAVGDSMEHDIAGAARVGLRSALVAGGIHAATLKVEWGRLPTPDVWQAFAAAAESLPDYLLPAFTW